MRKTRFIPLLLALSTTPGLARQTTSTSIIGLDDTFRPVEGAVLIADSNTLEVLSRDDVGQTAFVDLQPWETAFVALGETVTPRGTALGMALGAGIPGQIIDGYDPSHVHTLHQPLALPRRVAALTTNQLQITASPYHSRWELILPYDAPYDFNSEVALLHTSREINGYLAYNGVNYDPSQDVLGVVLRNGAVDLGGEGLFVRIDCGGHGFNGPPSLSFIHLAFDSDAAPLYPPATARVVRWDGDQAYVFLDHNLAEGDNVILLQHGSVDEDGGTTGGIVQLETYPASRPDFFAGEGDGDPVDCVPNKPGPPDKGLDDCLPPYPNNWFVWLFSNCTWTRLGTACEIKTFKNGEGSCGKKGGGTGRQETETLSGSVSVGGTVRGVNISATGSYEVSSIRTENYNYDKGKHGCGECWAPFVHINMCVSQWQYWNHRYEATGVSSGIGDPGIYIAAYCAIPAEKTETVCQGEVQHTSNTCDRTCK